MKVLIKNKEYWFHKNTVNEANRFQVDKDAVPFMPIKTQTGAFTYDDKGLTTGTHLMNCLSISGPVEGNKWGVYAGESMTCYQEAKNFSKSRFPWNSLEIVTKEIKNTYNNSVVDMRLLKIPKFYYKIESDETGMSIKFSSQHLDGYSISPAHAEKFTQLYNGDVFFQDKDWVYIDTLPTQSKYYMTSFTSRVLARYNITDTIAEWKKIYNNQISTVYKDEDQQPYISTMWTIDYQMTLFLLMLGEFGYIPYIANAGGNSYGCIKNHTSVTDTYVYDGIGLCYHGLQIPFVPFIQDCAGNGTNKFAIMELTNFNEQYSAYFEDRQQAVTIDLENNANLAFNPKYEGLEVTPISLGAITNDYVIGDNLDNKPLLMLGYRGNNNIDSFTCNFNQLIIDKNLSGMQRVILLPQEI